MTGRNCLWLNLNFVTLYVLLAIMTWMAGYGGALIWQNYCTCLTVSFDSVKSQSMKRWLALRRFWKEIDWQFSDPRIVTGTCVCISPMCKIEILNKGSIMCYQLSVSRYFYCFLEEISNSHLLLNATAKTINGARCVSVDTATMEVAPR